MQSMDIAFKNVEVAFDDVNGSQKRVNLHSNNIPKLLNKSGSVTL